MAELKEKLGAATFILCVIAAGIIYEAPYSIHWGTSSSEFFVRMIASSAVTLLGLAIFAYSSSAS